MSIIVCNCQHCDEQQFQTLSCVHYTIFSVVKLDLFIRALLLDRILPLEKTTRTPRVHLVKFVFITFYSKDHCTIRMFNSIIIIKLFYNMIFLFITTLSQDMFIVHFLNFIYICILEFYYYWYIIVCTFMAISNTSLMLLSIN